MTRKQLIYAIVAGVVFVALCVLMSGCAMFGNPAFEQLTAQYEAMVADGQITSVEADAFIRAWSIYAQTNPEGLPPWAKAVGEIGQTLLAGYLGYKTTMVVRNKREEQIWGPPPPIESRAKKARA